MTSDKSKQRLNDAKRDVAAACVDMQAQHAQLLADHQERLEYLEKLAERLEREPDINLREVQHQVRRVLGRRGERRSLGAGDRAARGPGVATGPGAVRVPMRAKLPKEASGARSNTGTVRTSATKVKAVVTRAVGRIDGHLIQLILKPTARAVDEVEIALLLRYRRGLAAHMQDLPDDPVLLESLTSFAEEAEQAFAALTGDAVGRTREFLRYTRLLIGQVVALGGPGEPSKAELAQLRKVLAKDEAQAQAVTAKASVMIQRLRAMVTQKTASREGALIDRLLG